MVLTLKNLNTNNSIDRKTFKLPYIIKVYLSNVLQELEPLKENIYFDIIEEIDVFAVYIDLDQFRKGSKKMTRYLIFKGDYNTNTNEFNGGVTYFCSNIIDNNKTVNLETYYKL